MFYFLLYFEITIIIKKYSIYIVRCQSCEYYVIV
jgi:hypothetical protein